MAPQVFYKNYERRIMYALKKTLKQQSLFMLIMCLSCILDQRSPFLAVRNYSLFSLCIILSSTVVVMMCFPPLVTIYEFNQFLCCVKREKDLSSQLDEINYQERQYKKAISISRQQNIQRQVNSQADDQEQNKTVQAHQEDKRCDWLQECEEQEDDDIQLGSRCERFLDKVLSKLT